MSAAKGNNQKKQTNEYTTTGKNAVVKVIFGIFFLTLGFCWLLSMLTATNGGYTAKFSNALNGLCGIICIPFPVLLMWTGAKLMVSTRHKVNARSTWIAFILYALILAGYTLIKPYAEEGSYLLYVKNNMLVPRYAAFLKQAYVDGAKGAGGLMGMLIAYPVWQIMGPVLGVVFVAGVMIALLFVLMRKNPGELIRQWSESAEYRQARREERRQQKEAERAAREAEENARQMVREPVVQQVPMAPHMMQQQVEMQEEEYQYYPDVPAYQNGTQQAPVRQTVQQVEGFYPVSNELYDEKFPLHAPQEQQAYYNPYVREVQQSAAAYPYGNEASEEKPKTEETASPARKYPWQRAEARQTEEMSDQEERMVSDVPAPAEEGYPASVPPAHPPMPEDDAAIDEEETVINRFIDLRPVTTEQDDRNVYAKGLQAEEEPEDELPWEEEAQPQPVNPKADEKKESKSKSSWADMVQKRQQELKSNEMPAHTTKKGEPKPVYTDPVMPITGERIPIKPQPKPKEDAKLDGTRAPQMKQTEMTMPIRYQAPPIRLLKDSKLVSSEDSAQEDNQRAEVIEGTLGSFGVDAEVKQIMHGPSITRFAIQIAPGVKVSKVTNTADNLALDLKTKHVRVEAPIQGTSYIGIEVPNKLVSTVSLKEVLDSEKMHNAASPLMVALGMDIAGSPVLCDLSKMPHLLIAGATGSGKSVCINSIVCSLLYRSSPEQVRLIMIDPKQVELTVYNSIPHLLVPVISDPRKAAGALAWVVQEMQERYGKFSAEGVRNLAGYNDLYRGTEKELPNIVVIIDEMADLMEVCRKDVEESIRRLAALARAAGIYMVLATQRPSVDVITGVVKNNIPSRIAFAVSSGTDSRTIIDINGAEKLMGKGDMLYKPAGSSPVRVQGCFVSDDEVNAITDYISRRYTTSYDPNIIEHLENAEKETPTADTIGGEERPHQGGDAGDGMDELLMEAIEMAVEDEQISTSLLQRRFRIGYARAGRLVDEMEKRGIVSASEGSKPRKCLLTREQYYQMFEDQ